MQGICYFISMVVCLLFPTNSSRAVKVVAAAATATSTMNHNCEAYNQNQTECSGRMMIGCCEWNDNNNTCVSVDGSSNTMSCNSTSNGTSSGDANRNKINNTSNHDDLCDESKCVTDIMSRNQYGAQYLFNGSFSCYYGDNQYGVPNRMLCADGYVPQAVENITNKYDGEQLHYFTCCPPTILPTNIPMQRHCSDPIVIDDNNVTECSDSMQPYMRMMKNNTADIVTEGKSLIESYVCCDTIIDDYNNNGTATILNITECVPYWNADYSQAYAVNSYASLRPLFCNAAEMGGDFQYQKYIDGNTYYECCKTQHMGTQSFVEDAAFYATVYPQIILSLLAVLSCAILIIVLSVPLVAHLKAPSKNTYSSYTLYLVYLAIPDLAFNFYVLGMYSSYANQVYNPFLTGIIINLWGTNWSNSIESSFILACSTANLYLNSIIAYEIFILLRNNKQVLRHKPPSLCSVTLKAMVVYLFSIVVFAINNYLEKMAMTQKYIEFEDRKSDQISLSILICNILVTYIVPIGFFFYVWIIVKVRNFLPSVSGREKELTLFFFRVVVCFCVFWLPGMCLVIIGTTPSFGIYAYTDHTGSSGYNNTAYQIGLYFVALQAIASTLMAMNKTDVRNYTKKLLSCSCVSRAADDMVED